MSQYNLQGVSPVRAEAGGTIAQYRVVEYGSGGTVTAANAIADCAYGVSLISAVSGDFLQLQQFGVAKVTASDAITAGAEVMITASGAGKVSTAAGATARSIGIALTAATADGDIIEVQLVGLPNVAGPANS
jgi:hypothetical protein